MASARLVQSYFSVKTGRWFRSQMCSSATLHLSASLFRYKISWTNGPQLLRSKGAIYRQQSHSQGQNSTRGGPYRLAWLCISLMRRHFKEARLAPFEQMEYFCEIVKWSRAQPPYGELAADQRASTRVSMGMRLQKNHL